MTELPKEAVVALKRSYKKAKKPREKERYHALWLKARGHPRDDICELLDVGQRSLGRWIQKYLRDGLSGVKDKPQAGNNRKLSNHQKDEIKKILNHQKPDDFGYEGKFWTVKILQRLVVDKFKVRYSDLSCQRLFKRSGFSYHKPNKVNRKRDPHMVKRFEEKLKKGSGNTKEKMVWYW